MLCCQLCTPEVLCLLLPLAAPCSVWQALLLVAWVPVTLLTSLHVEGYIFLCIWEKTKNNRTMQVLQWNVYIIHVLQVINLTTVSKFKNQTISITRINYVYDQSVLDLFHILLSGRYLQDPSIYNSSNRSISYNRSWSTFPAPGDLRPFSKLRVLLQ